MKIHLSILLFIIGLISSCVSNTDKYAKVKVETKKSISPKITTVSIPSNGSKLKDTLFISSRSAVSFWIDSVEIARRSKKEGEDFSTGADDYAEYAARADSFLHKQKLPIMHADGSRYLKFVQSNGAFTVVKTDTSALLHTLYFFDPNKKPYHADETLIEDEYKKFFH